MKPYCFVWLIVLFTIFSSTSSSRLVRSSHDSCNSNILNVSGIPFDTSSLRCVDVWPERVGYVGPSNGGAGLKQYYLGGHSPDQVIPDKGDLPWTKASIVSTSTSSNIAYIAFQLETSMPLPYLIFAIGPNGFFPSPANYSLAYHRYHYSFKMDYTSSG
ncbi:hypothetical protein K1719_017787 [Acacia pycnantha]|nr:hypothetical protein K1719_017787 [Acacia pycnantha]